MGGEKYSKFSNREFQIFQPEISLLLYIRHSISLSIIFACGSYILAYRALTFAGLERLLYGLRFARPPYTIHIDSLRQSL